jgi:hypothetical protein
MHQSVATLDKPEFINLQPLEINPLMSRCEIKVLYLNENRNGSFISKEVATEMAKSLRGAPIVGYYKESKEDFADHGEKVTIDDEGIKFEKMTKPYGFVAPDAKVWFQKFEDKDDFGNSIEREYLMTTGYLWTGQYEEAQLAIDEGRPQSMELDNKTLQGKWAENYNNGMEFFIINDAIFSKLCILGEDVEPCFEGASITAPQVSTTFTKVDDNFKKTLYTMMQELRSALEGGTKMADVNTNSVENKDNFSLENTAENQETTEEVTSTTVEETPTEAAPAAEGETEFAKDNEKEEDKKESETSDDSKEEDDKDKEKYTCDNKDDEDKKKYALLEEKFEELNNKFTAMEEEYQKLKDFKANVEDQEKDALISRFYMLDDEDKKDVIANKANYSLDDIESKLSVIYTKKQLAAAAEEKATNKEMISGVVTYSVNDINNVSGLPDWVKAVSEVEDNQ